MSIADTDHCPACDTDLLGAPIPQNYIEAGYYAPGVTRYSNLIGVEYLYTDPEHYDGISEWLCPECGYREGRWTGKALKDGEVERRFGRETNDG